MNSMCQVALVNALCMVVPNTCGSSEWNLLRVTVLVPRIFRWLLDFWKICAFLTVPMLLCCKPVALLGRLWCSHQFCSIVIPVPDSSAPELRWDEMA
jgi:hypothetical protein